MTLQDRNTIFGRAEVLKQLDGIVYDLEKNSSFVFLKGDAGIGKTTVLKGLMNGFPDLLTMYVQCTSLTDSDEMYKPCNDIFLELNKYEDTKDEKKSKIKDFFSAVSQSKVLNIGGKLLGFIPGMNTASAIVDLALTAMAPSDGNTDSQVELYKKDKIALYADLIIGVSKVRPLVVVFDDLQWADKGTTNVIKQIYQAFWAGERTENAMLCVICAMRDTEAKVDKLHNGVNELISFINRYAKNMHSEIILNPLNREAMLELISYGFDNNADISEGLIEWLVSKSMGNPLLMETYVSLLKSNQIVRSENGVWKDDCEVLLTDKTYVLKGKMLAAEKRGIFDNKAAVALEAVRNLSEDNLKAVYVAAIMDEAFPVDVLAKAVGMSEEEIFWNLRILEKIGLIKHIVTENNGFEEISKYEITSRILKEALQGDMPKRQVRTYEERIAEAYADKANMIGRYIEVIENMSKIEMLSQDRVDVKIAKLKETMNSMHKYAAIHYEEAGDILSSIDHNLNSYESCVDRFDELYQQAPSPADLDTIIYTVEDQMSHIDNLFETVINEILLESSEDKDKLQGLKIKYMTINAQFYKVFGYFNKAKEVISEAQQLAMFTETKADDVDMMMEMISIEYESGDFSSARDCVEKLVTYLEKHPGLDVSILQKKCADISEYFYEDFVMADQYAERIINILVNAKSSYIRGVLSRYYIVLLQNDCFDKANDIYRQIDSVDGVRNLLFNLSYFLNRVEDENFNDYYNDIDFDGELKHICYRNSYNWKWRIAVADRVLELLQHIALDHELTASDRCILLFSSIRILVWLHQHTAIPDLLDDVVELDRDITEKDQGIRDDIKLFNSMSLSVYEKYESVFVTKDNLMYALDNLASTIGEFEWNQLAMRAISFWPKFVSITEYKKIFQQLMLSSENETVDDIADVIEAAEFYLCEVGTEEEKKELLEYIDKNLIGQADNPGEKAKYIDECILSFSKDFLPGKIDEYAYFIEAMDLYLEAKDTESAMELLDLFNSRGDFKLPPKDFKKYKSLIEKIDECSNVKKNNKEDIRNNTVSLEDDEFLRWKEADRIFNTMYLLEEAEEDEDIDVKQYLISALHAYDLIKNNRMAESQKDDFCDKVAEMIFGFEDYLDGEDVFEVFGETCTDDEVRKVCFIKIMEFINESISINNSFRDYNRLIEEYKRVAYFFAGQIDSSEDDIEDECYESMDRLFCLGEEQDIFDLLIYEMKKYGRDKMLLDFIVDSSYDFEWLGEDLEEIIIPACEALNEMICNDRIRNLYVDHLKKYYPNNDFKDKVMAVFSKRS